MKKYLVVLGLMLTGLIIFGCVSNQTSITHYVCSNGNVVNDPYQCPKEKKGCLERPPESICDNVTTAHHYTCRDGSWELVSGAGEEYCYYGCEEGKCQEMLKNDEFDLLDVSWYTSFGTVCHSDANPSNSISITAFSKRELWCELYIDDVKRTNCFTERPEGVWGTCLAINGYNKELGTLWSAETDKDHTIKVCCKPGRFGHEGYSGDPVCKIKTLTRTSDCS